jgi:hypothetical protein
MPSSKGYKRNYKREYAIETPTRKANRASRNRAHRAFEKMFGPVAPGYDVDHKRELGKGGSNRLSNLQRQRASANRSYPRNKKGRMR